MSQWPGYYGMWDGVKSTSVASLCLHHNTVISMFMPWQPQLLEQSQISTPTYFLFPLKEQHVSHKTFFDKPVTRIIRYITNNEERSDSKYILSTASPPPAPCKCHLWNTRLFVMKHKTFPSVLFTVVGSVLHLGSQPWVSHSQIKVLQTFIFQSPNGTHRSCAQNIAF